MAQTGHDSATTAFLRDLRHALLHLYDAAELRKSPLLPLLGVERREDPASSLRRILLQAIASLKPPPDVPAQANAWRIYQILTLRYAEQYSQREVATDLSLSVRQVRRQDGLARRALADCLWISHGLRHRTLESPQPTSPQGDSDSSETDAPSREQEMEWLRRSLPCEATDVGVLVQGVLRTVTPLLQNCSVRLQCAVADRLPRVTAQPAAVRQGLLNALTTAVRYAAGGTVSLQAQCDRHNVCIRISPLPHPAGPATLSAQDRERLEMAGQLVRLAGGDLALLDGAEQPCSVELTLPAAEQFAVLVVDDNADTLELMRRYLAGSRYRFVAADEPGQALASIEESAPDIVVLDVMLPGVDGWELLERLREHPGTHGVPVIVCTILPQDDLALALEAAAFLRKPVSRRSLLATLDQLLELPATEPL